MTEPKTSSPLSGRANAKKPSVAGQPVDDEARSLMAERVAKVIEVIRPAIQADNGDISVHHVDTATGVVSVELHGACITCPISSQTLKDGVERILTTRVVGVTAVVHVGEELADERVVETGTAVSF